jgi:hypothetical protein
VAYGTDLNINVSSHLPSLCFIVVVSCSALCSGSNLDHDIGSLCLCVIFLSFSRQMPGWYHKTEHDYFFHIFPNSSFLITSIIVSHYAAFGRKEFYSYFEVKISLSAYRF